MSAITQLAHPQTATSTGTQFPAFTLGAERQMAADDLRQLHQPTA